jgi:hypothetical protein
MYSTPPSGAIDSSDKWPALTTVTASSARSISM